MSIINILCEYPNEIQELILSYVPINKLIKKNEINEIHPMIDNIIKNYIKNHLLSDMYQSSFILTMPLYSKMLKDRLFKLAFSYVNDFMKSVSKYSVGNSINMFNHFETPITTISFIITFKFIRVGQYYNGDTSDKTYTLTNLGCMDNRCAIYYYNKLRDIKYNEAIITFEIYNILLRQMDYSDTTTHIISMKLIKTHYPTGIKEENKAEELLIKYI